MIPRHQADSVRQALADTPVVVVVGPRQVGKSTLAEAIGSELQAPARISLDDFSQAAAAQHDPVELIRGLALPALIDEIQRAPELLLAIKGVVDQRRLASEPSAGMFLLTGSASLWDSSPTLESLAGRLERVRLRPLSMGEVEGRRERFIDALFDDDPPPVAGADSGREAVAEWILGGGFPEARGRSHERRNRWFGEYLGQVLERDIRDLASVRRPEDLMLLLRSCAARTAGLVNVSEMIADLGMTRSTGRRYYELLLRTFLIEEIPAWGVNLARAAVRRPKLLVADSGLASHLLGSSVDKILGDVDARPGPGALFETFVLGELLKAVDWAAERPVPFHWRDRSGREVDLLLERRDGSVTAIECKLASTVEGSDFRHLEFLRGQLGERFRGGAVVHTGPATARFGDRLWAVPVSALWA